MSYVEERAGTDAPAREQFMFEVRGGMTAARVDDEHKEWERGVPRSRDSDEAAAAVRDGDPGLGEHEGASS